MDVWPSTCNNFNSSPSYFSTWMEIAKVNHQRGWIWFQEKPTESKNQAFQKKNPPNQTCKLSSLGFHGKCFLYRSNFCDLHSGNLTQRWKIHHLKMYFLFKIGIFHCYVCLPEGKCHFRQRLAKSDSCSCALSRDDARAMEGWWTKPRNGWWWL